jgi:transposase, IS6 family
MIDAARHVARDRWFVDETYLKVAERWVYLHWAIDQHGQVIDVLASPRQDLDATGQFFAQASTAVRRLTEVTNRPGTAYPRVLDGCAEACHVEQYANNPIGTCQNPWRSRYGGAHSCQTPALLRGNAHHGAAVEDRGRRFRLQ